MSTATTDAEVAACPDTPYQQLLERLGRQTRRISQFGPLPSFRGEQSAKLFSFHHGHHAIKTPGAPEGNIIPLSSGIFP